MNRLPRARLVVPALLVAVTAVVLFARLGEPGRIFFDETYYVNDARAYLQAGVEDGFAVHPPVGKWLIAAGIAVFGDDPFGWRAAGAAAGTLTVLLTYAIGLRLFRRVGPALLAGLLVATDGLFVVQARTAMLDIFLALFVALGALLLLVDRDRSGPAPEPEPPIPAGGSTDAVDLDLPAVAGSNGGGAVLGLARGHGWRALAGVAFGLAVATKWSGVLALGAAGLLTLGWELAALRRRTGGRAAGLRRALGSVAVGLVLVPAGVYAVSYVPWLANYAETTEGDDDCPDATESGVCATSLPGRLAGLVRYQRAIARFHLGLEADHPYRAPAYTWPVLGRPVVYYWETCTPDRRDAVPETDPTSGAVTVPEPCVVEPGEAAEIIAVGNPALWWAFLGSGLVVVAGLFQRDRRAGVIAAFWAGQFLPWLIVSRPVFFFYMVPVVPFLALGVAYTVVYLDERRAIAGPAVAAALGAVAGLGIGLGVEQLFPRTAPVLRWIGLGVGAAVGAAVGGWRSRLAPATPGWVRERPGTWVGTAIAILAVAAFVYFLPVWTGIPLPEDAVRQRWWLRGWI